MKKSLIALALIGAFSGTAVAQSSVTLYGIVDIGVQMNTRGLNKGTTAAPRWEQESVWGVDSGYQSGSRWGMRGSEALGNGWNAVFTLEGGYSPDTGTLGQGGRLFGRQGWAGLQGGFGTFVAGRVATPSSGTGSFDQWGFVDPFATGWGINSLGSTFIPSNALRVDNALLWSSPNWGGFNFAAQYSFNISGAEVLPSNNNTNGYTLAGKWAGGPFAIAITYDAVGAPNNIGGDDQTMLQVGGTWDFKFAKLHAAYANQSGIRLVSSAGDPGGFKPTALQAFDNTAWMIGASVPLFGGSLLGSYQYADAKNAVGPTYSFEPDYSVWGIGYTYPFSRRTNWYVGYGQQAWDGKVACTGCLADPTNAYNKKQFALGIRHLF